MILFFDTTDFDSIVFALVDSGTGKARRQKIRMHHFDSEKTLPALQQFLKQHKIRGDKGIEKIFFVSGPGSFSGIRVGASIALALGFAWNIPIYALKKNKVPVNLSDLLKIKAKKVSSDPELDYGKPPKITKEKKKILRHTGVARPH